MKPVSTTEEEGAVALQRSDVQKSVEGRTVDGKDVAMPVVVGAVPGDHDQRHSTGDKIVELGSLLWSVVEPSLWSSPVDGFDPFRCAKMSWIDRTNFFLLYV